MIHLHKIKEYQMKETETLTFIQNELEAIYEEFDTYLNQLIILKPFIKDLIQASKGLEATYKLSNIIKKKH